MNLILTDKNHVADNVWAFRFRPDRRVTWLAGQFMKLELPHAAPDASGTKRWFTISGAPHDELLTVTTRVSGSSFKRALAGLEIGGRAQMIEEPAGDFTWREAEHPHVFAAQGIGITPFYAIIKDRAHRRLPVRATLILAHQPEAAPVYLPELQDWAGRDSTFQIIPFAGTLTASDVARLAPDLPHRFVYVSGPKSFLSLCLPPHNLPLNQLKQDNFPGYSVSNY